MNEAQQPSESDLHAHADGRLDSEKRVAIEAWLASHPEDAERVEAYRRVSAELREIYDPVLDEAVPRRLTRALTGPSRWWPAAKAAGWMLIGAAIGATAAWQLQSARPVAPSANDAGAVMARRAAVAHATYSPEVRHPVEVGADQEQHLVTWLSKRLGTKVSAPKLEEAGLSLVGGRLLPGENGPVAQFMYQSANGAPPRARTAKPPSATRGRTTSACSTGSTASAATRSPRPSCRRTSSCASPTWSTSSSKGADAPGTLVAKLAVCPFSKCRTSPWSSRRPTWLA